MISHRTFAVVIGISEYENLSRLKYADDDALAFKDYLINETNIDQQKDLFFYQNNDLKTDKELIGTIREIKREAKKGDVVYFYFAGHGDVENPDEGYNQAYLVFSNAMNSVYYSSGIKMDELNTELDILVSKTNANVVLILDACRSGKIKGKSDFQIEDAIRRSTLIHEMYTQESTNFVKILSCGADEYSREGREWAQDGYKGHGLFTYYLLRALRGEDESDQNKDGLVQVLDLDLYLKTQVSRVSSMNQIPITDGNQKLVLNAIQEKSGTRNNLANDLVTDSKSEHHKLIEQYLISPDVMPFEQFLKDVWSGALSKEQDQLLKERIGETASTIISNYILGKYAFVEKNDFLKAQKLLEFCMANDEIDKMNNSGDILAKKQLEHFYFFKAYNYINSDEPSEITLGLSFIDKMLTLNPSATFVHNLKGIAYLNLGKIKKARSEFQITLHHHPKWVYPMLNLATLHLEHTHDLDSSNFWVESILKIQPSYANAYYTRAITSTEKNDHISAIIDYNRAINLSPNVRYWSNLGGLYGNLGRTSDAIFAYEKALGLDSSFLLANYNLAQFYFETDNYFGVTECLDRINSEQLPMPVDPYIFFTMYSYTAQELKMFKRSSLAYYELHKLNPISGAPLISSIEMALELDQRLHLRFEKEIRSFETSGKKLIEFCDKKKFPKAYEHLATRD